MIMKRMTAAQAIVQCIKREKIEYVFCVPGESYLPVLDALHDEESIKVISARHEGGAAFMAEGFAKSTLKPGVVLATRGVGAANVSIGVHTAFQDSTPMVVFLGQVHSQFRGKEGFQEVDLDHFFKPITKWAVEVKDAKRIPEMVERAFRIAQSGRPGPVVISLPEDILAIEEKMYFGAPFIKPTPVPSEMEIKQIEKVLQAAARPVIVVGGGIKSSQAEQRLVEFAQKFSIPVAVAFRRHDCFPHNHPLYIGHLGLGADKKLLQAIRYADVIIALGTRLSEVTTQDYSLIQRDQKLIHIDIDYDTLGKVYSPSVGVVADINNALEKMLEMNVSVNWKAWANKQNEAYVKSSKLLVDTNASLNNHVMEILLSKLPEDSLITNDAGNFAGWLHKFYKFNYPHTYVGPTSGAMGYGMPAALGAKLAFPEKKVVAFAGDGGFMMTVQELETAVRYKIPIICLLFNNNMYGTIRMHQEIHYPYKVIGTNLGEVSFAKLAESMGAKGYTVRTAEQFSQAFEKAVQINDIVVIDILTDREQISVQQTIEQIRNK